MHLHLLGHPEVRGQEREEMGKSWRRTLDDGDLKKEDFEDRGASLRSDCCESCWLQAIKLGTT